MFLILGCPGTIFYLAFITIHAFLDGATTLSGKALNSESQKNSTICSQEQTNFPFSVTEDISVKEIFGWNISPIWLYKNSYPQMHTSIHALGDMCV